MEQSEASVERTPASEEPRGLFARLFRRQSSPPVERQVRSMDGPVHLYIDERLQAVPDQEGTIALWEGATLVYLGSAPQNLGGLRGELQAKRSAGGCTQSATHFQFEVVSNPSALLQDLLAEHRRQHGSLPRCNQ